MSYDSMIQSVFRQPKSSPLRQVSPLLPIVDVPQKSQGLTQSPQRCEIQNLGGTPREESGEDDKKEKTKHHET